MRRPLALCRRQSELPATDPEMAFCLIDADCRAAPCAPSTFAAVIAGTGYARIQPRRTGVAPRHRWPAGSPGQTVSNAGVLIVSLGRQVGASSAVGVGRTNRNRASLPTPGWSTGSGGTQLSRSVRARQRSRCRTRRRGTTGAGSPDELWDHDRHEYRGGEKWSDVRKTQPGLRVK